MIKTTKNKIIVVVVSLILALTFIAAYKFYKYKEEIKSLTVMEPDLTKIPDGDYEGEFDLSLVYAKVKVTLNGGKINKITILEHKNGRGKTAELITEDVINQQKLGVNTVTGATASSKALLLAMENALKKAATGH